ncbi:hypothetical protein ACH46_05905 [Gordonia phthalatica]|uniref:Protein kinase domain-containing protein n=1 Tax=Gordonia phthalatica TaxID=1136941 RepID=A0A0N9NKR3_9ACTN|nr:hypothetical protein ACH46_05905 [Gordonia phthalatica]
MNATDLFGPIGGSARTGRREFRRLAALLHPDRAAGDATVTQAFERLVVLYDQWRSPSAVVTGRSSSYTLTPTAMQGSVSVVYAATSAEGDAVAVKIPRTEAASRFLRGERSALRRLEAFTADPANAWLAPYYPRLLDTARAEVDADAVRPVNVLSAHGAAEGFVDLATVAAALPGGMDGRDWAWIHRRLLRAVAGAHAAGVVHGAIVPENILIHPEGHGVVLAGWSFAATPGARLPGRIASRRDLYPADLDEPASAALDVFMLHATMRALLAPSERRQQAFAAGCALTAPRMRPTAVALLGEYDELLEDLYGRRRFRPFPYTVSA